MRKYIFMFVLSFVMVTNVSAHDYPTIESVRFVVNCMAELGAQTEENLYTCTCRHDALVSKMTYEEYEDAMVVEHNRQMPGERGGFVRDNERGQKEYKKYIGLLKEVSMQCPVVRHLESPVKDEGVN